MVEAIIAVFITVVGVIGLYNIFSRMIISTSSSSSKLAAAYLAQEGIEVVRNIRDTNWLNPAKSWDTGLVDCSYGCEADYKTGTQEEETPLRPYYNGTYLNLDNNNFYSYSPGALTKYKRQITIEKIETDILKVNVLISWEDKKKPYSFEVDEYLYNWY